MIQHGQPDREPPPQAVGIYALLDAAGVANSDAPRGPTIEGQLHRRVFYRETSTPVVEELHGCLLAHPGCQRLLAQGQADVVVSVDDFRYDRELVGHCDWLVRSPSGLQVVELRSIEDLTQAPDFLRRAHYCRRLAWTQWLLSEELGCPADRFQPPVIIMVERRGQHRVRLFSFLAADLVEADERNQMALEKLLHSPDAVEVSIVERPFLEPFQTRPLICSPPGRRLSRISESESAAEAPVADPVPVPPTTAEPPTAPEPVHTDTDETVNPEADDVFGTVDLSHRRPRRRDALDRIATEHGETV